jgi:uncharacterized membrane protein YesL
MKTLTPEAIDTAMFSSVEGYAMSVTVAKEIKLHRINGVHSGITARQQFVICIHIFSLFVVNINVLPAPSDLGWGTLRSEIVLSVSGIITLAIVCLAPFTLLYVLPVFSSFRAVLTSAGCCQWQHFLSRRSHPPHTSLHLSGIAEVCHD